MFLKRIEINGFKSFANKTEFLINDGITGIVGPNGSGKSNIADAIRWVLGEQSSKNLRGAKMEDVIFNGSEKRQKKAFCEVSLYFDNTDMRLLADYSEIAVTRKMYRTGESEYYINRTPSRLKDILELFRDTGIGKEGYSIIGQGKIDELLSSKPTQRRKVFEEAAGVMKYRVRKEEAERKLERTNENLVRIDDIMEELTAQLEPLGEAAKKTAEYLSLYDENRKLDANIYLMNHAKHNARIVRLTEELSTIAEQMSEGNREHEEAERLLTELLRKNDELEELQNELTGRLGESVRCIEEKKGELKLISERRENLAFELARFEAEREEADAERKEAEKRRAELLAGDEGFSLLREKQEEELSSVTEKIAMRQEAFSAARAAEEERKQVELSLTRELYKKREELQKLSAAEENYEDMRFGLEDQIAVAVEEQEEQYSLIIEEQERERELEAKKTEAISALNENRVHINELKGELHSAEEAVLDISKALINCDTRGKLLTQLKAEYEGYSDGVKRLMRAASEDKELGSHIVCTLAEAISVPQQYETAIENVLGGALQNVIAYDEYDAKAAIEYLREKKLGRVTFLPLSALRVQYLTEEEEELLGLPGVLGVASELISCKETTRDAVDFMLARTVIVDDMDNAISLMRRAGYSFRAVTLKGDVLRPGGTMTGGSSERSFGLLSRERQLAALEREKEALISRRDAAEARLAAAKEREAEFSLAGKALLESLKQAEISLAEQKQRLAAAEHLKERASLRINELTDKLTALAREHSGSEEARDAIEASIAELDTLLSENTARAEELSRSSAAAAEALDLAKDELQEARIKKAELDMELKSQTEELARLAQEADRAGERAAQRAAAKEDAFCRLSADLVEAERKQLKASLIEEQSGSDELRRHQQELLERKYRAETQLEKVRLSLSSAGDKLWQDHELTYEGALAFKDEALGYSDSIKRVQEIKEAVRALGPINPTAIEEFERVNARHSFLTEQREDLLKAKDDLTGIIDKLMDSLRTNFSRRFMQINENFARIFKELFGGGRAGLSLDGEDVMECGIDISAEPPGKKLQYIALLSGGERALTAIALLFAMLSINPSPVCLLDEIDAPLDEANVARFGNYLKTIHSTQFLVITHRKPTMAICDSMYGVAMEERGVSRLVSVRMDKAAG